MLRTGVKRQSWWVCIMYDIAVALLVLPVRWEMNINQGNEWEPSNYIPLNKRQKRKPLFCFYYNSSRIINSNQQLFYKADAFLQKKKPYPKRELASFCFTWKHAAHPQLGVGMRGFVIGGHDVQRVSPHRLEPQNSSAKDQGCTENEITAVVKEGKQ